MAQRDKVIIINAHYDQCSRAYIELGQKMEFEPSSVCSYLVSFSLCFPSENSSSPKNEIKFFKKTYKIQCHQLHIWML